MAMNGPGMVLAVLLLWLAGCSDESASSTSSAAGSAGDARDANESAGSGQGGSGDARAGVGGGGSVEKSDGGSSDGAGSGGKPSIGVPSLACADGYRNGDETGHDCGGTCPNQDCCSNGYADIELGETGVDCGGDCGDCDHATYFVSNTGDDADDGRSLETAWQTIARVNDAVLEPGDAVLFERGGTWREELILTHSGTADAYITFGAYGSGDKPRIVGSERVTGWSEVTGQPNVYRSNNELAAPRERSGNSVTNHPASLFFGDASGSITWGNMEELHLNDEGAPTDIYECDASGARFSLLDEEYDWCWQDDHVYVYSPRGNPGDQYAFVEVPQRVAAIGQADHPPVEYVTLDGLALLFTLKYGYDDGWPMNVAVRGLTIQNCHIGYLGTKGAASAIGLQIWHSDMLVHNNEIHDCGRRNISYNVYGDVRDAGPVVFENVVFQYNNLHHGYHTTGFDISGGYADTFRGFVFANNIIWDDPSDDPQQHPNDFTSMGIYLDASVATFTDFAVYNNAFSHIKQKALVLSGVTDTEVFNNTFYGMNERAGGDYRAMVTVSGATQNLSLDNNLYYGDVSPDSFALQCVSFSGSSAEGTSMNHNLYFQAFDTQRLVDSYRMATWTDYLSETGWDADSPTPADPLFVDALHHDFRLQPNSPAIDAGTPIAGRSTDFAGNPIVGAPDIGAFEFQP